MPPFLRFGFVAVVWCAVAAVAFIVGGAEIGALAVVILAALTAASIRVAVSRWVYDYFRRKWS